METRPPIEYLIFMDEGNDGSGLDVDDAPLPTDPFAQFVESREAAFHRTAAGTSVLEKVAPAYREPTGDGNPWIRHEKIVSQPVESAFEPVDADPQSLEKRIGQSTKKINLAAFIRRRLAEGSTVQELVEYAARHDEQHARLIAEVAAEL